MSILDAYDESTQQVAKVMDAAPLPEPVPEPKHSAWTVVPRALAGAALEVAGNLVDVGSMIGQVAEGETRDYGDFEPLNTRPEASRPHYEMAREMRPDPLTAGLAENVIFGVGKGLSKAAFAVTAGGVLPGAAAFGLSEGMTTSEDLAEQGVDAATRKKVGAVTGVVSGASVLLPVAGTSLLKTAGLVAAGGPAAYIAQETIIKDILEEADYQKIADQHDPLDPVGLAVSTLLPAAFGAMAMRGAFKGKATQEQVDAAMVHNTTLKADQFEAETPQAVAAMKEAEESVKDIRATYEHTGDIGKAVTERLMDLGVPAQEAADKGLLWDSFFKSMEARTGKPADELMGRYFDRIFKAEDVPEGAMGQSEYKGVSDIEWTRDDRFIAEAKTHFGVTSNPREAGYIMPDGTMLDFTGRHYAEDHPSLRNQRSVDHRELTGENKNGHSMEGQFTQEHGSGSDFMHEFMDRTGAMRVDFNAGISSIMRPPTPEQLRVLGANTRGKYSATAYIDPTNGRLVDDVEWERTRPADIDKWFADKVGKPGKGALFQSANDQTNTPAFRNWFGDSKVVDAEGKPLVVYHGTDKKFTKFSFKNAGQKIIWFTSDKGAIDAGEVGAAGKGITMDMYASIKNPAGWKEYDKFGLDELEARGYDGVILPEKDGTFSGFVFEGKQLKSASRNRGTFDPNDPNILKQSAPVFYSQLSKSIEDAPAKVFGTGKQLKEWITANAGKLGVKKDEIEATGLNDWLSLQGKVSKEQVQEFLKNNGVKVEEVTLGKDGAARRISELQRQYPDDVLRAASNGEQGQMTDSDYQAWQRATEQVKTTEPAKFEKYQLPGGENYRELLLTLPTSTRSFDKYTPALDRLNSRILDTSISDAAREAAIAERERVTNLMNAEVKSAGFRSSHFDQPNILAHVRFNERTDADGKRVLFIEELQSDWAQKGRRVGFTDENAIKEAKAKAQAMRGEWEDANTKLDAAKVEVRRYAKAALAKMGLDSYQQIITAGAKRAELTLRFRDLQKEPAYARAIREEDRLNTIAGDLATRMGEYERGHGQDNTVPNAPFVGKTEAWTALALKRMIRYAAENGFDSIAWTTGEQQAARYDLSKTLSKVVVSKQGDLFKIGGTDLRGDVHDFGAHPAEKLEDIVGKELAAKIVQQKTPNDVYAGNDLKVGGEGMKGFYDQIVPQVANDVLKKLGGGKVTQIEVAKNGREGRSIRVEDRNNAKEDGRLFDQPGFDITPAMREKVMAGLPLFQKTVDGARGFLEFGQNGKMGIGLLASADKSTFLHESGHFFLEVMNDLSNEANAPPELRADMQAIHEWMGVSREQWASMSLEQKRPYHEQWARGFEQYLMEGKAPTSRLKEAFARFRDWLIEIYKSATALNVTLSDDVRKVMDNMLTVKESEPRQSPTGDGVPPPRASIGEDSAGNSDLDKALTSGEPLLDKIRPLDDPDLVATLQDMAANEAGWAEKGGNLMREFGDEGEVTGRTQWIPKAEWWPDRPGAGKANRKLNEAQVAEAVRKHLAGEPLKSLELQTVEYMSKIANDRLNSVEMIGDQEFGNTMQDWVAESVEPTTEKVFDSQAVARALDLNPEATMQAMERYDIHDDDAIIMAEIRSIIDEAGQQSLETAQGRAEDTGKEADPIQSEAERIVAEDPERRIPIGTGPDGEAVTLTAREYLDQARAQADQARQDVNLIKAAAECLLGQI